MLIVCKFYKYSNVFLDQEWDFEEGTEFRNVRCYEAFLLNKVIKNQERYFLQELKFLVFLHV